jgi:predicted dehydrogenase
VAVHAGPAPLWSSDVDAVAIATPAPSHFAIARDALLAGKDVFVEKPMVLSVEEGKQLVALARERRRVLMVGHLLLYQPAIRWLANYLSSGELGEVHSFHQERLNLGQARPVENALWSLGVHDVAVLLHLVREEPSRASVVGQRVLGEQVEDDVTLHLDFPSGVQAHLHASWLWPEKRRRLTVVGSRGMLVYDETAQQVVLHRKGIDRALKNWDEGHLQVFHGPAEPLRLELEHFCDRVADRQPPLSDGASGLAVVRVLEQAGLLLSQAASFRHGERRWEKRVG